MESNREKAIRCEVAANMHLSAANEYQAEGRIKAAQKHEEAAQRWLDRMNKLMGRA